MGDLYRDDELASGAKALWLWALLGSLGIHLVLMTAALSWKASLPPPARKVVTVEAITLTKACPVQSVGGGGQPTPPAAQACPPAPPPVQPAKPKPKPKPKPVVKKPVAPPECLTTAIPPVPPPPALAIPKPVAQPAPRPASPLASASRSSTSGGSTASPGRPGSSAAGPGGSGGGQGGGTGSGAGVGRGPGPGAGSLLQAYLHEVRRLLERQKQYPHMAQRLNIQGVAVLRFTIAADGRLEGNSLGKSSGEEVLDRAAQETVRKVGRFPPLPAALGKQRLTVEIPLAFRLKN